MRVRLLLLGSLAVCALTPARADAEPCASASLLLGRAVIGDSKDTSWEGGHATVRAGVYRRFPSRFDLGLELAYADFGRLSEVCLACDGCPCPDGRGGQGGAAVVARWRPNVGGWRPYVSGGAGANAIRFYGYFRGSERPDIAILPTMTAAAGIQAPTRPAVGIEARWESTRGFHYFRYDPAGGGDRYDRGNVDLYSILAGVHFN